ncbi:MFS transporter [bacterium]|nr:MFS transporter [bacterium]
MAKQKISRAAKFAVAVAALGYFVDVFDILLFSVVRTTSLNSLGVPVTELLNVGIYLINAQMLGMLVGGVLWGVWGDKRGRLSVLFGSILLYSVANILNGFAQTVDQYAVLRFFAGLGLAGELGAGVTLIVEILPKQSRGLGTTIIATVGVAGGLAASLVGRYWDWRTAYFIAGGMGIALLFLRVSVQESGLFNQVQKKASVARGSLLLLFSSADRVKRFVACLLAGVPIYFVLGVLVAFAPEIGAARGMGGSLTAADAVFYSYLGYISGDLASGLLSQYLRSRTRVLYLFILLTAIFSAALLAAPVPSLGYAHGLYVLLGFFSGYWAVFITVAAERFGTNLRATVATSVPNLVRGMVIPMTLSLKALRPHTGLAGACLTVLGVTTVLALVSVWSLKDSFSQDLEFLEK